MARKIKFPLKLADGTEARTLDELKEYFDIESVVGYFSDGRLLNWLQTRYYDDEADKVGQLSKDDPQLHKKLCEIFGIESAEEVDPEEIARRQERLNRLKQYTDDKEILERVDQVAFDQEDLSDLLDEDIALIYLCANRFTIPLRVTHKTYVGIGKAIAVIRTNKIVDFDALNIKFKGVRFDDDYQKILDAASKVETPAQKTTSRTPSSRAHEVKNFNNTSNERRVAKLIMKYVGGSENVQSVEHCATRLKLVVNDKSKIQAMDVENIDGVKGQFFGAQRYQIILGTEFADKVTKEFNSLMYESELEISPPQNFVDVEKKSAAKIKRDVRLNSPMNGKLVPLNSINDPVFASGAMGRGIAVKEPSGYVFSPFDGEVTVLFPTGHALGLKSDDGIELLIHVGMDTVKMNGKGFRPKVEVGDRVRRNQILLEFSPEAIKKAGYETTTPIVVTNHADFGNITFELDDQKITVDVNGKKSATKPKRDIKLPSPIVGTLIPLNNCNDPVFASGAMGRGIAVKEPSGYVFSPFDGEVTVLFPTGHALGLKSDDGIELLIHVGMDTVKMNGKGFRPGVEAGDRVRRGQLLLDFELEVIKRAGYETTTTIVVTNHADFGNITFELDDQKITVDVQGRFHWKYGTPPPQKKSGCFITTAVCDSFGKADDCYELTTFRNFRDGWLTAQPDGKNLIAEYYSVAPAIVDKINRLADAAKVYKNIWQKYLAPCLKLIERGDNQACKKLYVEMVTSLKKKFLED